MFIFLAASLWDPSEHVDKTAEFALSVSSLVQQLHAFCKDNGAWLRRTPFLWSLMRTLGQLSGSHMVPLQALGRFCPILNAIIEYEVNRSPSECKGTT